MNPIQFNNLKNNPLDPEFVAIAETFKPMGEAKAVWEGREILFITKVNEKEYKFNQDQAEKICELSKVIPEGYAQQRVERLRQKYFEASSPEEFLQKNFEKSFNNTYTPRRDLFEILKKFRKQFPSKNLAISDIKAEVKEDWNKKLTATYFTTIQFGNQKIVSEEPPVTCQRLDEKALEIQRIQFYSANNIPIDDSLLEKYVEND